MPGTLVTDAQAVTLADALNVTATGAESSVEISWPAEVQFVFEIGSTLANADNEFTFEVEGSDDPDFGSGVVSYGAVEVADGDEDTDKVLQARVYKQHVRLNVIRADGTGADLDSLTVKAQEAHYQRTATTSA